MYNNTKMSRKYFFRNQNTRHFIKAKAELDY